MRRSVCLLIAMTVLAVLSFAFSAFAVEHKYVEDFATTQYRDAMHTTAWWDTLAGELKLFPFVPTLAGACDTPGSARGVAVSGDHAFIADNNYGLQVIDISDPANPTLAGSFSTLGSAYGVAVSGDHAFVAEGSSGGLQVIDISDPASPTLAGAYDTPGGAQSVTV